MYLTLLPVCSIDNGIEEEDFLRSEKRKRDRLRRFCGVVDKSMESDVMNRTYSKQDTLDHDVDMNTTTAEPTKTIPDEKQGWYIGFNSSYIEWSCFG